MYTFYRGVYRVGDDFLCIKTLGQGEEDSHKRKAMIKRKGGGGVKGLGH